MNFVIQKRRFICSIAALGLMISIFYLKDNYRLQMVRPKVLFVTSEIRKIASLANQNTLSGEFSSVMPALTDLQDGSTTYGICWGDPFDIGKREGIQQVHCQVIQEPYYNGDPVDFEVNGNPFKIREAKDRGVIIYSYGPDEDDDIGIVEPDTHQLNRSTYDSTNGTISNGDIWYLIGIQ